MEEEKGKGTDERRSGEGVRCRDANSFLILLRVCVRIPTRLPAEDEAPRFLRKPKRHRNVHTYTPSVQLSTLFHEERVYSDNDTNTSAMHVTNRISITPFTRVLCHILRYYRLCSILLPLENSNSRMSLVTPSQ